MSRARPKNEADQKEANEMRTGMMLVIAWYKHPTDSIAPPAAFLALSARSNSREEMSPNSRKHCDCENNQQF